MRALALASLTTLLLSPALEAQSCSNLTVTGSGLPGTRLTFALTGAAEDSLALLVVGETTGNFEIRFGSLGTLTLGLVPPFLPLPLGRTDGSGNATLVLQIPNAPIPELNLHGQGFTVEISIGGGPPRLDFCTSDVEAFRIGG